MRSYLDVSEERITSIFRIENRAKKKLELTKSKLGKFCNFEGEGGSVSVLR
jgi:hypothetical protein